MRLALSVLVLVPAVAVAEDTVPPLISHDPLVEAVRGAPTSITAQIEDDSEIFAPTLYFRFSGARGYSSTAMQRKADAFVASVVALGDFEYWLEAYDEYGNGPAREGSPDVPHRVRVIEAPPVPPPDEDPIVVKRVDPFFDSGEGDAKQVITPDSPLYTQWWFLGAVGVVVAGSVVAGVLAAMPEPIHEITFGVQVTRP